MKKITKKQIAAAFRAADLTKIFRLYKLSTGTTSKESAGAIAWAYHNAPSKKARNNFILTLNHIRAERAKNQNPALRIEHNILADARRALLEELARGLDNYTKLPFIFNGELYVHPYLYFAHPFYKKEDYNRRYFFALNTETRRAFAALLCQAAEKMIARKLSKVI